MLKKLLKYKKLIFGAVIIPLVLLCGLKLFIIEISHHYKDLQELFYESESGYIIINKTTKEFGVVKKGWNRATIKTSKTETDLYYWVHKTRNKAKVEVYRPKPTLKNVNFETLNYLQIMDKIHLTELVYITGN